MAPSDMKLAFRDWLLQKLLATSAVSQHIPDEGIDAAARKLGVQAELLLEARAVFKIEQAKRGRSVLRRRVFQFDVWFPLPIWKAWQDECSYRQVESAPLLRSLLHDYLLSAREPAQLLQDWRWRGKVYPVNLRQGGGFKAKSQITRGAWHALHRRAKRLGTTRSAIIRGLVLEVLDGAHPRIQVIDAITMYDDENRYVLPP